MTQEQLAEVLGTSQQTYARWENCQITPPLKVLRDVATIYGIRVDDLFGSSAIDTVDPFTKYSAVKKGEKRLLSGFWGHIGIKLAGHPKSIWFPISDRGVDWIDRRISRPLNEENSGWLVFDTLAGTNVCVKESAIQRVRIINDNCDFPEGDWDIPDARSYAGIAPMILEGLRDFFEKGCVGPDEGVDINMWFDERRDNFEDKYSDTFMAVLLDEIRANAWSADKVRELDKTFFYFCDGVLERFEVGSDDTWQFKFDMENHINSQFRKLWKFENRGQEWDEYFSIDHLSMVVMPTHLMNEEEMEEIESELTSRAEQEIRVIE